ncbi:ABC transporter permease [Streptomyces sp. M10(2022)]
MRALGAGTPLRRGGGPVTAGLARASVRARPCAFGGVFAVLVLSATIVTASVALLVTVSDAPPSPERETLATMGAAFTIVTVYLSIFVIGQVMALAVTQHSRENALLRAVGALPWQLRRMVAAEALLTALPAIPAGYGLGHVLAGVWFDGMAAHDLVPAGLRLTVGWVPAAAAGVLVVTSQLGGLLASHRAARSRPSSALGEAAVARRGMTPLRVIAIVMALAGAVTLTLVAAAAPPDDTAELLPLVLLVHLVVVAMAGPAIGLLVTALASVPCGFSATRRWASWRWSTAVPEPADCRPPLRRWRWWWRSRW